MSDVLNFNFLISPFALKIFYYLGAVVIPVGSWLFTIWIKRKFMTLPKAANSIGKAAHELLGKKYRLQLIALFIAIFLFMELFWRMMFEFMIAYFQMRDALMQFMPQ